MAAAEAYVQGYARPIGPDGEPYGDPTFGAPTIGMSWALPTTQLLAFAAVTGVLTLAAAVFPAAWAGRRRILSAIVDH